MPAHNPNTASTDWATIRGDKWSAQLTGMEAMLAPVNEPLFRALALEAPVRIAEVGSGGGGTAIELLRRAPAGSVVHGFDISKTLVEIARGRVAGNDAIAFDVADMATASPAAPYDRLTSRFGVMFFDDPRAAFANLVRWLAPGGSFAFAVWGRMPDNAWMTEVREAVGSIVDIPRADPDGPGPFRYADASTLRALLEEVGFADVGVHEWRGTLPVGGGLPAAEAAQFALAAFSSLGELLAKAGGDATEKALHSLTSRFAAHETDGAVGLGASVSIVTGVRAS